jgi:hypothetical protein
MTYLEVILLIQERAEKVVSDRVLAIQTNKHLYSRKPDGTWEESEVTVSEEKFIPLPIEMPIEKKKR